MISLETQVLRTVRVERFKDEVVNGLVAGGEAEVNIALVKERLAVLRNGSTDDHSVDPGDVVSANRALESIERSERAKALMNPRPSLAKRIESDLEFGPRTRGTFGLD
jgi:hypothetical protein